MTLKIYKTIEVEITKDQWKTLWEHAQERLADMLEKPNQPLHGEDLLAQAVIEGMFPDLESGQDWSIHPDMYYDFDKRGEYA